MHRKPFKQRFTYPALGAAGVMCAACAAYYLWPGTGAAGLGRAVAGAVYFASVALGALVVYPVARLRGASLGERVLACATTPFLWATGACVRLSVSHPLAECLYWYLNPLNLWLGMFLLFEMGVAEMGCRVVLNRRGSALRVAAPGAVAAALGGLGLAVAAFAWGRGENFYVLFLAGYRALFGTGL